MIGSARLARGVTVPRGRTTVAPPAPSPAAPSARPKAAPSIPERGLSPNAEDLRTRHAQAARRKRFTLFLTAMAGLALVYLVQTSGVATTGYDIQRYQTERADWQRRNEQLRLELAKRRSLAWIESQAIGQLGMQPPTGVTYLRETSPAGTGR